VKIEGMSFKFYSESFEDIIRDVKVYVQETEAVEFAVNEDGVKQFFNFDQTDMTDFGSYDFSLYESYGDDVEVKIPLTMSEPFAYTPGKSLLVTIVFDAQDDDNCTMGSDYAPFYTSGIRSKGMTYTNNWSSFLDFAQGSDFPNATATLGCGTNVELPVTKIAYTYTEGGQGEVGQRGDTNLDGQVTIGDVTTLIDYLLSGVLPN
jgi:hypothetical protein